ncbi:PREDICTED: suppressor of tumorigenicity 14 protein homolog [Sturnus vulgaris]|uniref:suppressor of tumorigenicity 14 protein homolog n=1 Tax=Sturnus vulgaris TaxID=9172 RepID=UPI00071A92E6|nr:PREDICTED: suppressor of tumorigenicity 14 protein homolog [Sturnus vulgaris]
MNNLDEGVEFLPAMNSKKMEKRGPKRQVVVTVLIIVFLLVSLTTGLLFWHFKYRSTPIRKVFNGHLRVLNWEFLDAYENSSSPEFSMLAKKVKSTVRGFLPPSFCKQGIFLLPHGQGYMPCKVPWSFPCSL